MQTVAVDLAPGETLYSQTNCIAWMSDTIQMNTHTGCGLFAGIKRSLSGGSLFIATLTGPGHVWLQSMPIMNLAEEIGHYLPGVGSNGGGTLSKMAGATAVGGILGNLLGD
jgi:uncharacterized protein (AIM24 family)